MRDMTRPCPTCRHAANEHSDLAGCLFSDGTTYCDCTMGPSIIPDEPTSAPQTPSRAQTLAAGRAARDEGADAAGSGLPGHIETEWRTKAAEALTALAKTGVAFTADNVVDVAGMPPVPNMLGGLFIGASRRGEIVPVGYAQGTRAASHARVQRMWAGA